jgi:opacity protein-like surface antigen
MKSSLVIAAASLFLWSSGAVASPYAGIDLDADLVNLNSADSSLYPQSAVGPQVHVGYRFDGLNLAAELGYGSDRGKQDPDILRLNNLSLDGLYYVPLGGFLSLVLTAGGAEVNYGDSEPIFTVSQINGVNKTFRTGNTIFHGDEFDWRAGAGVSFALTDGYEIHFLTRYQPVSMGGLSNYSLALDFGMNFYFDL